MIRRAVFPFSALIVISSCGLVILSSDAAARGKGKSVTSTTAGTSSTPTATLKFSKKRPPRAYSGSNPQGAARSQD